MFFKKEVTTQWTRYNLAKRRMICWSRFFFLKKRGDECHGVLGVFPPKTGSERLLVQFFLFFQKGDECYGGPLLAFPLLSLSPSLSRALFPLSLPPSLSVTHKHTHTHTHTQVILNHMCPISKRDSAWPKKKIKEISFRSCTEISKRDSAWPKVVTCQKRSTTVSRALLQWACITWHCMIEKRKFEAPEKLGRSSIKKLWGAYLYFFSTHFKKTKNIQEALTEASIWPHVLVTCQKRPTTE